MDDHSTPTQPAAASSSSPSPSPSARRLATSSLCAALACCAFVLLLAAAVGRRPPLQPRAAWHHFSNLQAQQQQQKPLSRHDDAAAAHQAPSPAPDVVGGWSFQEEEAGAGAPAPAPSPAEEEGDGECDVYDGEWVVDDAAAAGYYPLYDAAECPFLSDQVACRRNGRPDSGYERWRWRPRGCGARTRLGGAEALEACRDKRLVFVGDSLNRNMWESLACILYAALPDRSRTRIIDDDASQYRIFRAMDYNCSVEFFWSPFLVKLETKLDQTRALKLDQLPNMLQRTLGADVIVFNTGHWWTHTGKLKAWDHLERDGKMVEMAGEEAFNRALRTWARWIDQNVDPSTTRIFFRSVSPEHKSVNWCYNQTHPISNGTIAPWFPKGLVTIVERNIRSMRTPVSYLNITHLSEIRIDAHPSVYTINREGKPLNITQRQQPLTYADCSHWCLPGLPDTWNVLLLDSLMRTTSNVHLQG
ncbi:hypothetical protein U9M48_018462 [Paspalum notatum var. saurae]|uniref:Trichome birefringence-like N-terminal domain-containing protein n=1 Tax=Paspalum notatum var. saurae TaxID=547442 RepID=A0AAQ3TA25_PASNO